MRHRKSGRKFNRNSSHRKSMFKNMICSLIRKECLLTSLNKAKELRTIIEPIITRSKCDSIMNRRLVFSKVRNNEIVSKLFNELGKRFINRSGGYTSILKCGFRTGDSAKLAYIKLIN